MQASVFASFIVDYLKQNILPESKIPIIIFFDGNTYRNRNSILANALLMLSVEYGVTITS